MDDVLGPGRVAGRTVPPCLRLPPMAAPAYAGSWSSLPAPLTDWVYAVLCVFCYLS
jgi:hypothetical protein